MNLFAHASVGRSTSTKRSCAARADVQSMCHTSLRVESLRARTRPLHECLTAITVGVHWGDAAKKPTTRFVRKGCSDDERDRLRLFPLAGSKGRKHPWRSSGQRSLRARSQAKEGLLSTSSMVDSRGASDLQDKKNMAENKLYVGNLPFGTTEDQLAQTFGEYGTVGRASIVTDRDTGRSRGFGFVEMGTDQEAQAAIAALDGTMLDGRTIQVNVARPREGGSGPGRGGPRGGGGGRGGDRGGDRGGRW